MSSRLRIDDVAPNGYTLDRATVRQKKTGRPVRFELTEQTRQAIDEYLRITRRKPGEFLFAGAATIVVSRNVNTHVSSANGSPASASTRSSSARTRCAEPRRR
jgi:integrase